MKWKVKVNAVAADGKAAFLGSVEVDADTREQAEREAIDQLWDSRLDAASCTADCDADLVYSCKHEGNDCTWSGTIEEMDLITDYNERVQPGELAPAGQCPACGCMFGVDDLDVPSYTLDVVAEIMRQRRYTVMVPAGGTASNTGYAINGELSVTVEDLLLTEDRSQLNKLLKQAAEECMYARDLNVSWDYWHYGRHAEFAEECGMLAMSRLFSAAWQIEHRVQGADDPQSAQAARDEIRSAYISVG